jgi:ubiquinone/menaquinone biosynthesis C-methylase UbiE
MTPREPTEHLHRPPDSTPATGDPATNREKTLEEIQSVYADYADWLHRLDWVDRALTGRYRRRRFGDADGRVLDVACGTGTNFRYLPASVDLVGIDISSDMLQKAAATLGDLGRKGTLRQMDAQALAFPDDSFDTVISALSTCTFPDPTAALREMERVCKPEGRMLLVEHGKSDIGVVARYQEWRSEAHYAKMGCRWTQEPLDVVEAAGLTVRSVDTGGLGMITSMEIVPDDTERERDSGDG